METTELIKDKSMCSGCGACSIICASQAITIKADKSGTLFPTINSEKCVDCKQCVKVCPIKSSSIFHESICFYAATSNDPMLLMNAASGGVFSSIAKKAIEKGWYISGAVSEFENGRNYTHHIISNSLAKLENIQGSKYVQSDTQDIFLKVKTILDSGSSVLFSGTPCQVDALYHYLGGRSIEKLFTIDVICHGVPGNDVFNDYLKILEEYLHGNICKVAFRDKTLSGWSLKGIVEYYRNGKKKKALLLPKFSSYYKFFLGSDLYRDSCYECKYACPSRISDLTIGDYWGIEREHPEIVKEWDVRKGISCLIINTPKGKELIKSMGEYLELKKTSFEQIANDNGQLVSPSKCTPEAIKLKKMLSQNGYRAIEEYYCSKYIQKGKTSLWYGLPFKVQVVLNRIINLIKKH